MAHKIVWSKAARRQFDGIVNYLGTEWNEKTASDFVGRANGIIELLSLYPEAGSIEVRENNIRGFLITKQVRLFYELRRSEIILLSFFDTRSSPLKKPKRK